MQSVWVFVLIIMDVISTEGSLCILHRLCESSNIIVIAQMELVVVGVEGSRATIRCSESPLRLPSVQWLVNGSTLEDLNLRNVSVVLDPDLQASFLDFTELPLEYNMTRVNCSANATSGRRVSSTLLLLVQGMT